MRYRVILTVQVPYSFFSQQELVWQLMNQLATHNHVPPLVPLLILN